MSRVESRTLWDSCSQRVTKLQINKILFTCLNDGNNSIDWMESLRRSSYSLNVSFGFKTVSNRDNRIFDSFDVLGLGVGTTLASF